MFIVIAIEYENQLQLHNSDLVAIKQNQLQLYWYQEGHIVNMNVRDARDSRDALASWLLYTWSKFWKIMGVEKQNECKGWLVNPIVSR